MTTILIQKIDEALRGEVIERRGETDYGERVLTNAWEDSGDDKSLS